MNSLIHGFGSGFGRAIGRFMAFLVLGFVVLKILDVFNVDISKFTKFLYLDVKAASSDTWTDLVDLKDTHLFENDMYSYIQICNNTNLDSCAVFGRNAQTDYGWNAITVNFNTNYLRLYNNQTILKNYKKYRLVITQTGNTWTPVNSRYFITLNSIGGTNLYSSNTVYSSPDNTIYIEFTPLNNNDILDLYIRTTQAPNYFWLSSGSKNFTVVKLQELESENTDNSQAIIDNQTQNTQDIINNQNNNTQDIINNQNQNTQDIINSNKSCSTVDKYSIDIDNKYLGINGTLNTSSSFGITKYFTISNSSIIKVITYRTGSASLCFYNSKKVLISCLESSSMALNSTLTIPDGSKYFRASIEKSNNRPRFELCTNGNESLNDSITDDNVSSDTGTSFFSDFEDEDFGLSEIVTLPINTIQQLTSKTCLPLNVPIPYTNRNVSLPCMTQVYQSKLPTIYNIYKTVSFGIIAYFIAIDIFYMVKGFKDPESDKVEVLDL